MTEPVVSQPPPPPPFHCPMCGELFPVDAVKCPACGEELLSEPLKQHRPLWQQILIAFAILAIINGILWALLILLLVICAISFST